VLSVREAGVPQGLDRKGTAADKPRAVGELRPQQIGGAAAVLDAGDRISGRLQRHEGLPRRIGVGFERRQLRPATVGPLFGRSAVADVRMSTADALAHVRPSSCIARSCVVRGLAVPSQARARAIRSSGDEPYNCSARRLNAVAVNASPSSGGLIAGSGWNAPSSLCQAAMTLAIAAVVASAS
jgi:hypothetical protein